MSRKFKKEILSWCFFDFGQSAFSTIIVTFVFSAYFTKLVAVTEVQGISDFGWALSFSGLCVALFSPFLGAIADRTSRKKPWILTFTILGAFFTALLFFTEPYSHFIFYGLCIFIIANTLTEMTQVFYNAYLPVIAAKKEIGKISGYGWGSGYIGGLISLVLALLIFINGNWISHAMAFNIRSTTLMAALWMILFSLPFFLLVRDHYFFERSAEHVIHSGVRSVFKTFKSIRKHRTLFLFLIARLLYTDGMNTLLSLGGVFAAVIFHMRFDELLLFGISMNVAAGCGAFLLAALDDKIGSAKMVLITLFMIVVLGIAILFTYDKMIFWCLALGVGLFIGPVQSASRSLMAHLAPREMMTQMFGLYALSGKITSFIGPFFVATITRVSHSERMGMASIFILLLIGLCIMLPVLKKEK